MHCERKQSQRRGSDGDYDRPQALDSGVKQCLDQRVAQALAFFDKLEQDDLVADDYANQARDSKKRHETEWHAHVAVGSAHLGYI